MPSRQSLGERLESPPLPLVCSVYVKLEEAEQSDDAAVTSAGLAAAANDEARQRAIAACAVKHLFL